jgi:hypothetical protein
MVGTVLTDIDPELAAANTRSVPEVSKVIPVPPVSPVSKIMLLPLSASMYIHASRVTGPVPLTSPRESSAAKVVPPLAPVKSKAAFIPGIALSGLVV